jgi:hypothetical protein
VAEQTRLTATTDAPTDDHDTDGDWLVMPSVERAISHATPFPAFDAAGEWRVREAVHDANLSQMRRIAEQEADA